VVGKRVVGAIQGAPGGAPVGEVRLEGGHK